MKWQVSGYNREDRDLIRLPNAEYRIEGNRLVAPSGSSRYKNSLNGYSRGIELLLQRRSSNGLAGWIAYSFSKTRYDDLVSHESFWGDFDQRHTVNAYASYRFTAKFSGSRDNCLQVPGPISQSDFNHLSILHNDSQLGLTARV